MPCLAPITGACAIGRLQKASDRAITLEKAVMMADRRALLPCQREAQLIKNGNGPMAVTRSIFTTVHSLSQIMEKGYHRYAVRRKSHSMGEHVLIHFKAVTGKSAPLLVMATAAAGEVVRL